MPLVTTDLRHSSAQSSVLEKGYSQSLTLGRRGCILCVLFDKLLLFSGILYCIHGFFSLGSMTHGGDLKEPGQQGLYSEVQARPS